MAMIAAFQAVYPGSKLKLRFNPQKSGAFANVPACAYLSLNIFFQICSYD